MYAQFLKFITIGIDFAPFYLFWIIMYKREHIKGGVYIVQRFIMYVQARIASFLKGGDRVIQNIFTSKKSTSQIMGVG